MPIKSSRRNRRALASSLLPPQAAVIVMWDAQPLAPGGVSQVALLLYVLATNGDGETERVTVNPEDWLLGLTPEIGLILEDESFIPATGVLLTTVGAEDALAVAFAAPIPDGASLMIPPWSESLRGQNGEWLAGGVQQLSPPTTSILIHTAEVESSTEVGVTLVSAETGGPLDVFALVIPGVQLNGQAPSSITPGGILPTNLWKITVAAPLGAPSAAVTLVIPTGNSAGVGPMNYMVGVVP